MSKRTFVMGANMRQIEKMEAARELFIQGIREKGITDEEIENCRRFSDLHSQNPTLKRGVAGPAVVRGERFQLTDEHTNGHGETVLEGYRPIGGGRFEKVRITEAHATRNTRIVSNVRGH